MTFMLYVQNIWRLYGNNDFEHSKYYGYFKYDMNNITTKIFIIISIQRHDKDLICLTLSPSSFMVNKFILFMFTYTCEETVVGHIKDVALDD